MSTAAIPGPLRPSPLHLPAAQAGSPPPGTLAGNAAEPKADLTIHRISHTHHGRTLLLLGHAAEHLANARRFAEGQGDDRAQAEAIHILLELSRVVFDEFAMRHARRHRLEQWIIMRAVALIESRGQKRARVSQSHEQPASGFIPC